MDCPDCNSNTRVLETRAKVYRRRLCKQCSHQFWTEEVAAPMANWDWRGNPAKATEPEPDPAPDFKTPFNWHNPFSK